MTSPYQRAAIGSALLGLLACVLPRAATASCGDYVIFSGPGRHEARSHAPLGFAPVGLPAPARPCHGPQCSGNPRVPDAPPAPHRSSPPRSETAGCLVADRAEFTNSGTPLPQDDAPAHPLDVAGGIFHPPRLAA